MGLRANKLEIWDGRFLLKTTKADVSVVPLLSVYERLSKEQKQAVKLVPEAALAGLPAFVQNSDTGQNFAVFTGAEFSRTSLIEKG